MAKADLTAQRLRELLDYDPETGNFTWRVGIGSRAKAGTAAGCKDHMGYFTIGIAGRCYRSHRLAWLYMTGSWPIHFIDHLDGNGENNAIANLRDVHTSINSQNQRHARCDNSHGFLGVSRSRSRWQARIMVDGARKYLGIFQTPEAAYAAYLTAKRALHPGGTL